MSSSDPIGGFLELECGQHEYAPKGAVLLNSGRSCLEYIIRANGITHLHIPKYTCDAVVEPLQRLGIAYDVYGITEDLEIADDIVLRDEGDALLATNYFGVKDEYSVSLAKKYGSRLILDCSQAFYFPQQLPSPTFYSPRKFFGLPDGGIVYSGKPLTDELEQDTSYERSVHLLKRIDVGPEAAYADFKAADESLSGQPAKVMSTLTRRLLGTIDIEAARQQRLKNFAYIHERLGKTNKLAIHPQYVQGPLCYPYLPDVEILRQKLLDAKVFVPTYWPNVLEWCQPDELEYRLAQNILPLPIDQRYNEQHMERIVSIIHGS